MQPHEHESDRPAYVKSVDGAVDISRGVPLTFLMRVFGLSRYKCDIALRKVRPIGEGKHKVPLFDFAEAAAYLVTPKIDVEKYISNLKPDQLPERLRETYWAALLKEQRWREKAGDLWPTAVVLERMTEVLSDMRSMLTLIPDDLDREIGLTPEDMRKASSVVKRIQDKMHKHLTAVAKNGRTLNQLGELDAKRAAPRQRPERDDSDII